jgi:hypothetical protein
LLIPVSSQQIEKSTPVYWDFSNQPIPRFGAGLLLGYESFAPTIRAIDQTGLPVLTATLPLRDAPNARVRDLSAARDGCLVAAISLTGPSGGPSSALVWLHRDGTLRRLVHTSPFSAFRIVAAPDGAVWAAGRVHDAAFNEVPSHEILRRYDAEGRLTAALLTRDSLRPSRQHPAEEARLALGPDRIGFFSATAQEWVEASLTGVLAGRWKTAPLPQRSIFSGAALDGRGVVFVSVYAPTDPPRGRVIGANALYRLDKSAGAWVPVEFPELFGPGKDACLLGSEGGRLVFRRRLPNASFLDWVSMPWPTG